MSLSSYQAEIYVAATAKQAYSALTSSIDKWWSTSAVQALETGQQFIVSFEENTSWELVVKSLSNNSNIVWQVISAHHNISTLINKDEWLGTEICWVIEEGDLGSKISLVHQGLIEKLSCYDICITGWEYYLESLRQYLETGKGLPYAENS